LKSQCDLDDPILAKDSLNRLRISISNWRPSLSESDKERVVEFLKSIETGDQAPLCYVDPGKYVQHNLNIGDGLEG
jgi:hypothetical protein